MKNLIDTIKKQAKSRCLSLDLMGIALLNTLSPTELKEAMATISRICHNIENIYLNQCHLGLMDQAHIKVCFDSLAGCRCFDSGLPTDWQAAVLGLT